MGVLKATVGSLDVTQYLKEFSATGSGDARPGSGTLTLTKEAAGLDIRPMMVVNVWETFDGAGNGVASRGRFFGGVVRNRDTTNIGTTKQWDLACDDWNIIGTRGLVRDMQASKAVSLAAATFKAQVTQLTQIIQRNGALSVNTEINTTDAVVVDYATMPAVTWEGGHTYFWYLGQLCAKLVELSPAVRPAYYLSTSITVGGSEAFGPPTLYIIDKANPPAPAFIFSDTPGVGEHGLYDNFKRKSASNEIVQRVQVRTPTQVLTGENTAAQAAYPNPYQNHKGAPNYDGYWMGEPIGVQVTTNAEGQALVDRRVENLGNPRDSYELVTDQRLRVGEYVTVTWALEGLSAVALQVVEAQYRIEPTLGVWCTATLNARKLRIFGTAEGDTYAPPVEGDTVPPLPPENVVLAGNVYNPGSGLTDLTFTWDVSPSPDTSHYLLVPPENSSYPTTRIDGAGTTTVTIGYPPGETFEFVMKAVDTSSNVGEGAPDPPITGTAATWTAHASLPNPSFEFLNRADLTLPRFWQRVITGSGTAVVDTTDVSHGRRSLKLDTSGAVGDDTGVRSEFFVAEGLSTLHYELRLFAKASVVGETLSYNVTLYNTAEVGVAARIGQFTLTTDWAEYRAEVQMENLGPLMKLQLSFSDSTARTVRVDNVSMLPQQRTEAYRDESVTEAKLSAAAQAALRAEVSLVDRARMAPGWRSLGTLTTNAFREADVVHDGTNYYVFYTGVYETTRTDVRSASTPEGIVGATPTTNIVAAKYPSVVYDADTETWHLWGTVTSPSIMTKHYTSTSPTTGWTYSDDVDDVLVIDAYFAKHPTNGYWYGIGFTNGADTPLKLLRATVPEGPWTDLGDVFATNGEPPFGNNARADPGLALGVDGRDYVFFSGHPGTILTNGWFPSIVEVDLAAGRVKGNPVSLLDDRETWMLAGYSGTAYGLSDLVFLRVAGQPDRIFGFANDGGNSGNWPWGCLDLERIVVPPDGRRPDDLVRLDPNRGMDVATGIAPTLATGAAWLSGGLEITTSGGLAKGYPANAKIADGTLYIDFTPKGTQAAVAVIAYVGGANYTVGPAFQVYLSSNQIIGDIQGTDNVAANIASGVTAVSGTRYRVAIRKAGNEFRMWVNGVPVGTTTHAVASTLTGLQIWAAGGQVTLSQAARYPFLGTVHDMVVVGSAMGQSFVKRYG